MRNSRLPSAHLLVRAIKLKVCKIIECRLAKADLGEQPWVQYPDDGIVPRFGGALVRLKRKPQGMAQVNAPIQQSRRQSIVLHFEQPIPGIATDVGKATTCHLRVFVMKKLLKFSICLGLGPIFDLGQPCTKKSGIQRMAPACASKPPSMWLSKYWGLTPLGRYQRMVTNQLDDAFHKLPKARAAIWAGNRGTRRVSCTKS